MNNKIEPHYVDFNTAKWLKEKGFDEYCEGWAYLDENCMAMQYDFKTCVKMPEQWQVIEWLRINHDIHVTYDIGLTGCYGLIQYRHSKGSLYLSKWVNEQENPFSSPQEAYSAAFDYIKDNNLI
jgi:hypothetical protein